MNTRLLIAAGLSATAAMASAGTVQMGAMQAGAWKRLFRPDVEKVIGKRIYIDSASVVAGGMGRNFRQADTLLGNTQTFAKGTTIYYRRSVDCTNARSVTYAWHAVNVRGEALGSATVPSATVQTFGWDTPQGKVLGYVCKGIRPT